MEENYENQPNPVSQYQMQLNEFPRLPEKSNIGEKPFNPILRAKKRQTSSIANNDLQKGTTKIKNAQSRNLEIESKTQFSMIKQSKEDTFENARMTKQIYNDIMTIDKCITLTVLFSVLLTTYTWDLEFEEQQNFILIGVLYLIMGSSILIFIFAIYRKKRLQLLTKYKKEAPFDSTIFDQYKWWELLGQAIIVLVHPSPFLTHIRIWVNNHNELDGNYYYNLNDLLTIFTSLKLIYIFQINLQGTQYGSSSVYRISKMFGCKVDSVFILKCLMKDSPIMNVFLTIVMSILYFGWVIMISEKPLDRIYNNGYLKHNYSNCCWMIVATMTTVGYGDIFPRTIQGRIIMIICSIFGVVVVSLMVVTVTKTLEFEGAESNAFTVIKKLDYKTKIKEIALRLLVTINRKKTSNAPKEEKARFERISTLIEKFRKMRRDYRAIGEINLVEELSRNFQNVVNHISDVKEMIMEQNELEGIQDDDDDPDSEEQVLEQIENQTSSSNDNGNDSDDEDSNRKTLLPIKKLVNHSNQSISKSKFSNISSFKPRKTNKPLMSMKKQEKIEEIRMSVRNTDSLKKHEGQQSKMELLERKRKSIVPDVISMADRKYKREYDSLNLPAGNRRGTILNIQGIQNTQGIKSSRRTNKAGTLLDGPTGLGSYRPGTLLAGKKRAYVINQIIKEDAAFTKGGLDGELIKTGLDFSPKNNNVFTSSDRFYNNYSKPNNEGVKKYDRPQLYSQPSEEYNINTGINSIKHSNDTNNMSSGQLTRKRKSSFAMSKPKKSEFDKDQEQIPSDLEDIQCKLMYSKS